MGALPLISVCIPAYNNQDFIAFAIESVLNQTYGNYELIITDDKSSDHTVSVIKGFSDPRIRFLQNDVNLGIGGNWNKALSCASGKYVKLLCGDDILYPECLQRQLKLLEAPENSSVALAICSTNVINARNEIVLQRRAFRSGRINGPKLVRECVRWGTNLIGEPAVGLFRREWLAKTGLFDPSNPYLIDLVFWAELLKHGDAIVDPNRLAAFRISSGSLSAKIGLKQAAGFRAFIRKIHQEPLYQTRWYDVFSGSMLSLQWCFLRNVFIQCRSGRRLQKSRPQMSS